MSKIYDPLISHDQQINASLKNTEIIDENNQNQLNNNQNVYMKLCKASWLTGGSLILETIPLTISVMFISRSNIEHGIDAFGLGQTWMGCFGYGIVNGIACGLETLVSQAYGSQKYQLCGQLFNRAITINFALIVVIFFPLFFLSDILGLLSRNDSLLKNTEIYVRYMIPSILIYGLNSNIKCFLNGQNIYNYQFYCQIISTLSHILWCYIFIDLYNLGFLGCALAQTLSEIVALVTLLLVMKLSGCSEKVIVPFSLQFFFNWFPFLKIAIPIGSLLWLEYICFELQTLQASFLDQNQFSAGVIMFTFATLYYQFSYGVSIASTTYIGNEMGNQNPDLAKKFSYATGVIIIVFLVITQILLSVFKDQFIDFYTTNISIKEKLDQYFYLMQTFIILDSIQAIFTGIVRAIGRESFACLCFIFFYLIVGSFSSYLFTFQINLQMEGIWLGMIVGSSLYIILQVVSLLFQDWNQLITEIEDKLQKQQDQPNQIEQIFDNPQKNIKILLD